MTDDDTDVPRPVADVRPSARTLHGVAWTDPYAWLRADNWQEVMRDPSVLPGDIRDYLEAENRYAEAGLADTARLREVLFKEYRGRLVEDESSVPEDDGPWSYYARFEEGGQHAIHCRRPRGGGEETILFHGDEASKGKAFFQVAACEPSPNHALVCVATDESGAELWTLGFREAETGSWLEDRIPETSGSLVFVDDQTVLYTVLDDNHRPRTVKRHVLGTPTESDQVVYFEEDPGFFVGLDKTESRRFVVIDAHDHETSEVRVLDVGAGEGATWQCVAPRQEGVEYDVSHHGERLIIRTNAEGAEDYGLVSMSLDALTKAQGRKAWTPLLPHEPGRLRLGYTVFENHLVVIERVDGLPRLALYALGAEGLGPESFVAFEEDAYALGLQGSREFATTVFRFSYSSMTTPRQVFDYDLATNKRELRKSQEVPSGHDPANYRSRRLMIPSHDGEEVPVSMLHHVETPLDGTAPVLVYGYGAYGHAMPAGFSITRLSLVDRGVVFAIAHVRGGMDRGYRWYRQGKREKKTNTFLDFIAASEGLAKMGFVDASRIAAQGGSAGGLLMGAVANLRPDLFAAIVADVPFVDVLNTMLDDTLPLTPPEWPEWGNPIVSAEDFETIRRYSPYDNVAATEYPEMLVMAGLTDPRVTYWEPAKWVARLRATKTDDRPLLLKTNMDAGHGGASGRFSALEELALEHAFVLRALGRADAAPLPSS